MATPLLASIEEPAQLRKLTQSQLPTIAEELRSELIAIGAEKGGHFAGSLGTVELAVALHYVFDTPRDRLIWDVGHQAYGHKALTGRREGLWRVKKADGPSGFLRRSESEYDVFGAGHAGTSISAALGVTEALRLKDSSAQAVAIIGDGAATAGMSFEALNHGGELRNDLKVVFNDNGMSIAPSIGGLARNSMTSKYFESLGLRYLGPIDGHDLELLVPAITELREASGPCVLHIRTRKGSGFEPAEKDPYGWHATAPFNQDSGERSPSGGAKSWTACFADSLIRLADRDPRVVALTAAMPDGTGLDKFAKAHPDRMYDVGIAEQHAVTFAAGMATEGLRPVCAIYSTFLQRAFDQIVHDVALQGLPVAFVLDRAGLVGADGPTHHGVLDFSYLRAIPNLVVSAPRNENDLQHLLAGAVEADGPWAIRIPRGAALGTPLDPDAKPIPAGMGETLRSGRDIALLGIGKTVATLEAVAEQLAERGIEAEVIDARFVKPLDEARIRDAAIRCRNVVTVEDHFAQGGFGSAVLELLARDVPEARVKVLGHADEFIEHGDVIDQWQSSGIDVDSITQNTENWLAQIQ